MGNGKTVVRGGYGLYYGRTSNGTIFNALTQTGLRDPVTGLPDLTRTVASISVSPTTPGRPVFPTILTAIPSSLGPSVTVFRLDPNFKNPRLQELNIGVEQEVIKNLTVSASFVYTKGERLPVVVDTNLPAPAFQRTYLLPSGQTITTPFGAGVTCTSVQPVGCPAGNGVNIALSRPDPTAGAINKQTSSGATYYRALFVEVKRRFAQRFQFNVAYTLAKAENLSGTAGGDGTGPESPFGGSTLFNQFDTKSSRGIAPTDQRHRFVTNGIVQLPELKQSNRFARFLLNGYRLSGIFTAESGRPYSATVSFPTISFSSNGKIYSPFGGGTLGIGGSSLAPDIERNSIYGDSNYKLDLRLTRTFRIKERFSVELIGEAFNIFNRSNFNGFNTTVYNVIMPTGIQDVSVPISFANNPTFGAPNNDGSQPDGTNARRFQIAARMRF